MLWSKSEPPSTPSGSPGPSATPSGLSQASANLQQSLVNPAGYFQRYGYPLPIHDVATHAEFVSCYDRRMRNPSWVIEHLTTATRRIKDGDRQKSFFSEDTSVPAPFRARLADYFRSGYDRGHQAPAADASWSQTAMDETFSLANISPQVGAGFNRDYWAHFERFGRNLTDKYASVRIVTGPLYLPQRGPDGKMRVTYEVIGNPPNVAVPTHFFKLIIGEDPILPSLPRNGVAVAAFVLPNAPIDNNTPLTAFQMPVDALDHAAGVEFLPKLPPHQRRDLCREIQCSVDVVEFNDAVKKLPPPAQRPALPGR